MYRTPVHEGREGMGARLPVTAKGGLYLPLIRIHMERVRDVSPMNLTRDTAGAAPARSTI